MEQVFMIGAIVILVAILIFSRLAWVDKINQFGALLVIAILVALNTFNIGPKTEWQFVPYIVTILLAVTLESWQWLKRAPRPLTALVAISFIVTLICYNFEGQL